MVSMHQRQKNSGLTLVEVLVVVALLAFLISVAMIYRSKQNRAEWDALAASGADWIFDVYCRVEHEVFAADEDVVFLCEVDNTSPYPYDFSWRSTVIFTGDFPLNTPLRWLVVDESSPAYTASPADMTTRTVSPRRPLRLRLKLDAPLKNQRHIPTFVRPLTLTTKVSIFSKYNGDKNAVISKPISFTINPPSGRVDDGSVKAIDPKPLPVAYRSPRLAELIQKATKDALERGSRIQ